MREDQIIIGGQAVIEGVMMRAPHGYAVAVRKQNGDIVTKGARLPILAEKYPLLKLPVLRGAAVLIQSLSLGVKALNFSANVTFADLELEAGKDQESAAPRSGSTTAWTLIMGAIFNVLVFILLPLLLTNMIFVYIGSGTIQSHSASGRWYTEAWTWLRAALKPVRPSIPFNLVDGVIRMTFFLIMIWGMSRLRDINRLFQYHGAEHKTVYTWEAGEALTVENARTKRRQHPRCGTSFLMVVMLVAIIAYSIVKFDSLVLNFLTRILLMPVIAGLSYEIIRASAMSGAQFVLSIITRPGMWLQNITTKEPDDEQLEVAIVALKESLALEPITRTEPALVA